MRLCKHLHRYANNAIRAAGSTVARPLHANDDNGRGMWPTSDAAWRWTLRTRTCDLVRHDRQCDVVAAVKVVSHMRQHEQVLHDRAVKVRLCRHRAKVSPTPTITTDGATDRKWCSCINHGG